MNKQESQRPHQDPSLEDLIVGTEQKFISSLPDGMELTDEQIANMLIMSRTLGSDTDEPERGGEPLVETLGRASFRRGTLPKDERIDGTDRRQEINVVELADDFVKATLIGEFEKYLSDQDIARVHGDRESAQE